MAYSQELELPSCILRSDKVNLLHNSYDQAESSYYLVGGWNQPIWKICPSNGIISPSVCEHKTYLKLPPSYISTFKKWRLHYDYPPWKIKSSPLKSDGWKTTCTFLFAAQWLFRGKLAVTTFGWGKPSRLQDVILRSRVTHGILRAYVASLKKQM